MVNWSTINSKLDKSADENGVISYDIPRREYLKKLHDLTGRNTILYGSSWLQKQDQESVNLSLIDSKDALAFKECVEELEGDKLDLILHSPGGFAESADHIVGYLREHFGDIRVIVPYLAMSAATLIACSANRIMLGKQSALGPIDPQIRLPVESGTRMVAAKDIIQQFELALHVAKNQGVEVAFPMFSQFGPDLIIKSHNAMNLNRNLAKDWLAEYMFAGKEDRLCIASGIADWLIDSEDSNSHSRCLMASQLKQKGLKIDIMEDNTEINNLVMSVFYVMERTFDKTLALKMVENHNGHALIRMKNVSQNLDLRIEQQPQPLPVSPERRQNGKQRGSNRRRKGNRKKR